MPVTIGGGLTFCGRELKPEELDMIRQITREFSTLSLTELAHTVCELLEWRRPNGGLKSRECYLFLLALHRSEEHTSELQSLRHLVCRLLLEKKKTESSTMQQRTNTATTCSSSSCERDH